MIHAFLVTLGVLTAIWVFRFRAVFLPVAGVAAVVLFGVWLIGSHWEHEENLRFAHQYSTTTVEAIRPVQELPTPTPTPEPESWTADRVAKSGIFKDF